jgi:hypothetical protein
MPGGRGIASSRSIRPRFFSQTQQISIEVLEAEGYGGARCRFGVLYSRSAACLDQKGGQIHVTAREDYSKLRPSVSAGRQVEPGNDPRLQ